MTRFFNLLCRVIARLRPQPPADTDIQFAKLRRALEKQINADERRGGDHG